MPTPDEIQKMITEIAVRHNIEVSYHQEYYGFCPPIRSALYNGRRTVMVGSDFMHETPDYDWRHPSDFLISYLEICLGNDWFLEELQKPEKERHEIVKWYMGGKSNLNESVALKWYAPNGKALALLHLAYDLFILKSTNNLLEILINRLKINDHNFNGARYEIFVFATLVRAGFFIEYEDEVSGQNGRVSECQARHIQSGEYVSIEAKTRNVYGILGSKKGRQSKVRLYDALKDAIDKNISNPYVVFLDVNFPELEVTEDEQKILKIRNELEKLIANYPTSLPNLICVTNIPFHYGKNDALPKESTFGFLNINNPKIEFKNSAQIISSIITAMDQYTFLPAEFQEANKFAELAFPALSKKQMEHGD